MAEVDPSTVSLLVDADNQGRTALMKAAIKGMTKFAIALIKRGADVNIKDKYGCTALMYAIEHRRDDIAAALIIEIKDLSVNSVDNQGRTLLMKAAIKGMTKFALELIKRGADVNMKDKYGKTALMYSIDETNEGTALSIIKHSNIDLNAVDNQGRTAMMTATIKGMPEFALELIKCGADVDLTDTEGKTALMFIGLAERGIVYWELTLARLVNAGADVNKSDYQGNTALIYNVKYEDSVEVLIEQGKASVDSKNSLGRTALFYALAESISSARYLVEHGADLESIDNYNVSVLSYFIHHCINNRMPYRILVGEVVDFFKKNGIKKKTLAHAIIDAIFCKLLLLKIETTDYLLYITLTDLLSCAAELSKKRLSMFKHSKRRSYDDLVQTISWPNISFADILIALDKLLYLGADVNTSDEKGNTISHYITLLGIFDFNTDEAWEVFHLLTNKGLKINLKNCDSETPLLFMLSNAVKHVEHRTLNMEYLTKTCEFLLHKDPTLAKDISQNGDSVFHLIVKLYAGAKDISDAYFEPCILEVVNTFCDPRVRGFTFNPFNLEWNTPLHIWAASSSPKLKEANHNRNTSDEMTWKGPSEKILDHLLKIDAVLPAKNKKGETALHVCRTWTAVKMLVEAGAKTNDFDLTERSPLLSAAQKSLFLENPGCFYPDVLPSESPTFWRTVMHMGFDLWTCDKNGDTIISNLIKENSFELADGLIEIACDNSERLSDDTLLGVLNAICKDDSTQITWKSILVDKLLKQIKTTRRSFDMSLPLRSCCMNIIDHYAVQRRTKSAELDSVHFEIAKQLLRYGTRGESCMDIVEACPPLQTLLSTPITTEERPLVIPWTSISQKHQHLLNEVARGLNHNVQEPYWYHNVPIGRGAFGHVFVGIHEKDSMEVAIKRVQYTQQDREEDIREIRNFASITDCNHIVRYLAFFQTTDFSFIIMELMEGNLIEYFASGPCTQKEAKALCQHVIVGLKYLHERNIIHRDLKPTNILYKTDPQFCLKIADFGLSRRIDGNASFTVMATGVGTRGWIAPEVCKSTNHEHSKSSDVFSLGLVLHYVLSKDHRNPFSPADCTGKSALENIPKTETNILTNNMEGWDSSLGPEASHLIRGMLKCTNEKERPTASTVSEHPMFWLKKKKLYFLSAVGNQEEFECPRAKRSRIGPLTMVERDLQNEFATIVKLGSWDDPRYTQTLGILTEMKKTITRADGTKVKGRKNYVYRSSVELVRFIRNVIAHVSEASRPSAIRTMILEDAVFLDEFPSLVMEVYKAVTKHGWDVSRDEIQHVLTND